MTYDHKPYLKIYPVICECGEDASEVRSGVFDFADKQFVETVVYFYCAFCKKKYAK